MKRHFITLLLFTLLTACQSAPVEPVTDETTEEEVPQKVSTNIYDPETIAVGDIVASMGVISIEPFLESREMDAYNKVVDFDGKLILTGEVFYEDVFFNGYCFRNMTEESLAQIPTTADSTGDAWFCFSNQDKAAELLSDAEGQVTVSTVGYQDVRFEGEASDSSSLLELIQP